MELVREGRVDRCQVASFQCYPIAQNAIVFRDTHLQFADC